MMTTRVRSIVAAGAFALAACGGGDQPPAEGGAAQQQTPAGGAGGLLAAGEQRYQQICITCHMPDGKGQPAVYPPLAGSEIVQGDPRYPIAIVLYGLQGPITVHGETYNSAMQPWGMLSDDDVAGVVSYVRQAWGNTAAPVTAADVSAIRSRFGSRVAWTIDELRAAFPDSQ